MAHGLVREGFGRLPQFLSKRPIMLADTVDAACDRLLLAATNRGEMPGISAVMALSSGDGAVGSLMRRFATAILARTGFSASS